ncbi:MAG TPA: LysR substrate-binding domain-containing protein [Gammaproteobacteria bacterium]|nr:LysR substrate-binding domain-containing protein [Gammaproteobacteria bacterium]
MGHRKLQFNALRAFEAAARHLSVSGAAKELSVTHSAVSHQLRRLESDLDIKLFQRTNRGLLITPAGESLASVLIDSFERIGAAIEELCEKDPESSIKVTCTPTFASKWLLPRLAEWYARPDARRVHLHPTLDLLELHSGTVDCAIRCGIPPWKGLRHELLMPIHLVPVCSPQYAAGREVPLREAEILRHDLLHADIGDITPGEEWRDWLGGIGAESPLELPGASFHDPALAMQAAADGLGLAIGYLELIGHDLQTGNLVTAHSRIVKHRYSYYLVYPEQRNDDEGLQLFLDWIRRRQ